MMASISSSRSRWCSRSAQPAAQVRERTRARAAPSSHRDLEPFERCDVVAQQVALLLRVRADVQ
jgi:hypothetical protein